MYLGVLGRIGNRSGQKAKICLVRPSCIRSAIKEQLATIRRMNQQEYHAITRPKAAVLSAEVTALPGAPPDSSE